MRDGSLPSKVLPIGVSVYQEPLHLAERGKPSLKLFNGIGWMLSKQDLHWLLHRE